MKVLTAAQMREVDRRAGAIGIPGLVLMENAGHRVAEYLARRFAPLSCQRVVVLCGKGNNGGDGFVVARQLWTRLRPASLHVALAGEPDGLRGDAAANYRMLEAVGCPVSGEITAEMRAATIVVDALLGTGLDGPPRGRIGEWITEINQGFPAASIVAVDVPSGLGFSGVRAGVTITFAAPKIEHYQEPGCGDVGELIVQPIGIPDSLIGDPAHWLNVSEARDFETLFQSRPSSAHKGDFGHVLVIGGAPGKAGAAAMAGLAALRAGAGLVTVACSELNLSPVAPELMTASLVLSDLSGTLEGKSVLAVGPGLGVAPESATLVRRLLESVEQPMILDADALSVAGGNDVSGRILTPHPGEMSRLCGLSTRQIQEDRIGIAHKFSQERGATVVLKGQKTLIAFPDGSVWINPTGGPALATAGSGDILTGLMAGLVAQFPAHRDLAVRAAVWLHGRAGDLGAAAMGEKSLVATDLLRSLPSAMRECAPVPH